MIEVDSAPAILLMTVLTLLCKFAQAVAAMRADFLVAGMAVRRCGAILLALLVAVPAGLAGVPATQGEVGKVVIEGGGVELDDVRIASLVVGMATAAGLLSHLSGAAVKATPFEYVGTDVIVTFKAQARFLGSIAEGTVAVVTVVLEIRVSFDQGARHEQGLEGIGTGETSWHEQHHPEQKFSLPGTHRQCACPCQYMCTATTWTVPVIMSSMKSGRCRRFHRAKKRS